MTERVKVFTFISGHGTTLLEPPVEDQINQWLSSTDAELVDMRQSESERPGVGHHVTVTVWYRPKCG